MHVKLTPKLDHYVLSKVDSGRYADSSEVIREALRRMQDEESRQLAAFDHLASDELREVQKAVSSGILEIEAGGVRECAGDPELRRLFIELRAEAHRELTATHQDREAPG